MNLHTSQPYWLLKNGLLHTYPLLREDVKIEYLVMGGGITGALVAWYLAEAGKSVILVDRRHIGMGSTCASTALLQYEIDTPLHKLAEYVGEKDAARSYWLCIEAINKIEDICKNLSGRLEFERKPSLYYASRKADVEIIDLEHAIRRKHGIRVERWSTEEVAKHFPFAAPAALYSPHDGAQVDAYALTHALLQDAIRKGAQIFDKTEVTEIEHHARDVVAQTAYGPKIHAKKLVIASGYESGNYLKERNLIRLHSTYVVTSEPFDRETLWHENALIWETARPYLYLRTTGDRRVLVGGRDEPFYSPGKRDRLLTRKTRELLRDVEKKFPALTPLRADFNWAGTFAETKDGLPYIGSVPEHPHTIFALGFGGNGITFSQVAAEIIRDGAIGHKNHDAHIFSFDRKSE